MIPCERLFLLCVVLSAVVLCGSDKENDRNGKHLLALLGYLQGYKIGHEYALQLPPYLITPVIILPSVNQQQSVNIQQNNNDENYQESGGTIQTITPIRIVALINDTTSNKNNGTDKEKHVDEKEEIPNAEKLNDDYDDIEVIPSMVSKVNTTTDIENITENLTQNDLDSNNTTQETNTTNMIELPSVSITTNATGNNETTFNHTGPYPAPAYNIDLIKNVSLTTDGSLTENNQALPPILDNRWQNFTLRANLSNLMSNNNATVINEPNNSKSPSENVTKPPEERGPYPYPNAWYNNEAIDQLSITTNYYTNESPLPSDGWGSYSPMNELPNGFKPLAGLYYDGYLNKPIKKYGFVPQNYYWN